MGSFADSLTVAAYAKLNYTLDVLSKRPDGYHNIASVMQTISLADTLTLTRRARAGITLDCDEPGVPADPSNLAWRAAEGALRAADRDDGVHIRLRKQIPSQAGLGGGSSDAAATLHAVNALCDLRLGADGLRELAIDLGSDVPFFLTAGTATVRGRGEAVTPLPDGPSFWFVIVKPDLDISTARAYQALDAIRGRVSARTSRAMEAVVREGDRERVVARMTNDFEAAAYTDNLALALLHDEMLMARARNARLCGSGSAVFGVAYTEAEANEVARVLRLKYSCVYVCRSVSRQEALGNRGAR